jgi:D-arabinono-1,4-lactone oxidase
MSTPGPSPATAPVVKEPDGFYHPSSEAELAALVKFATDQGKQLRVRGAAHSISHAIYTDRPVGWPNTVNEQSPPPGPNIDVMLDRYRGWRVRDEADKLVEADAGIHMGEDRTNPENASLTTSLLWQLWNDKRWAFSNLGGITRQTVSGFTATGSSGGSLKYSVNDDIWGFRVIDSSGTVQEVTRASNPGLFFAMAPNLGLLGVVSKIIFKCVDTFNIAGQEAITTIEDCEIDVFGGGTAKKPSLEQFLRNADYARVEWWPQRGAERVQVWQAQRIQPQLGFHRRTYEEFTDRPQLTQVGISLIYTVLCNLDDLSQAKPQVARTFARAKQLLQTSSPLDKLGPLGCVLATVLAFAGKVAIEALIDLVVKPSAGWLKRKRPTIFPILLSFFVSLDSQKKGTQKGEPQAFQDEAWHGLPMDNESDDDLLPIAFTEMWVPLGRTEQVMQVLRDYFTSPADVHESYRRTGLFAWELYAAKPTPFWMSASHEAGEEWQDGVFRIDPFWFAGTPVDPSTFYLQFWELLRQHEIPFRLHWGKYQPAPNAGAGGWVSYFESQYPRWNEFKALRARLDPHGTFLNSYWRDQLNI